MYCKRGILLIQPYHLLPPPKLMYNVYIFNADILHEVKSQKQFSHPDDDMRRIAGENTLVNIE